METNAIKQVENIGRELRITRHRNGKVAVEYIYNKYKQNGIFRSFNHFLSVMRVYSVFWASRGNETKKDIYNTIYTIID